MNWIYTSYKGINGTSELPNTTSITQHLEGYPWLIKNKYFTVVVHLCHGGSLDVSQLLLETTHLSFEGIIIIFDQEKVVVVVWFNLILIYSEGGMGVPQHCNIAKTFLTTPYHNLFHHANTTNTTALKFIRHHSFGKANTTHQKHLHPRNTAPW